MGWWFLPNGSARSAMPDSVERLGFSRCPKCDCHRAVLSQVHPSMRRVITSQPSENRGMDPSNYHSELICDQCGHTILLRDDMGNRTTLKR